MTARLNVCGYDHVYAVGDIVDLDDPKTASYAMTQAQVVVENITSQLDGDEPRAVHERDTQRRILLPLGGQLPGEVGPAPADVDTVYARKGKDLFTARFDNCPPA